MHCSEYAKRLEAAQHMYSESEPVQMLHSCFKCEQTGLHKAVGMRKALDRSTVRSGLEERRDSSPSLQVFLFFNSSHFVLIPHAGQTIRAHIRGNVAPYVYAQSP